MSNPRIRKQFSTRAFFVIVTCICLTVGFFSAKARTQRRAVVAISKAGGTAHYDNSLGDDYWARPDHRHVVSFPDKVPSRFSLRARSCLRQFVGTDFVDKVIGVEFPAQCARLSESDWALLKRLPDLMYINFRGDTLTDSEMPFIAQLPTVRKVLSDSKLVTDDGIAALSDATALEDIIIPNSKISSTGYQHLSSISNLKKAYFAPVILRDNDIDFLSRQSRIEYLSYVRFELTDEGFHRISDCHSLRELHVKADEFSDKALRHIANMKSLEGLWVPSATSLSPEQLRQFKTLTNCVVLY